VAHGEDDLAERVASITDDELTRIGRLGAYYAFSEDALALHAGSRKTDHRLRQTRPGSSASFGQDETLFGYLTARH